MDKSISEYVTQSKTEPLTQRFKDIVKPKISQIESPSLTINTNDFIYSGGNSVLFLLRMQ